MAIWQFDFFLLPRVPFEARFGEVKTNLPRESVLDDADNWPNDNVAQEVIADLSQILPEVPDYWAAVYGKAWGDEDSHIIEVGFDEGHLQDVFVRVDLRRFYTNYAQSLIRPLLHLARRHDLLIFTEDNDVLSPDEKAFEEALYNSRAMRFLYDPQG